MDPQKFDDNLSPEKAKEYLEKAKSLEAQGRPEQALTELRRAVLCDPRLQEAQYRLGMACKSRISADPRFLAMAFDCFRQAALLDLNHQDAHQQYITAAHQAGRLDDLREEYKNLAQKNPDNVNIQTCYKNLLAMMMAMIPEKVNVSGSSASKTLLRALLFLSFGAIGLGALLIMGPHLFDPMGKILEAEQVKNLFNLGISLSLIGFVGLLIQSRLKSE